MKPEDFNGLKMPGDNDDEAAREFGRQIAMDGVLRELFDTQENSLASTSLETKKSDVRRANKGGGVASQALAIAALAACGLTLLVMNNAWNPIQTADNPASVVTNVVERNDLAITGWEVQSHPNAKVERIDDSTLRLTQGELALVAKQDDAPQLRIITPNSEFNSSGSQCLIGVHQLTKTIAGEPPMFKQMTRVFLLAGLATLSNDLGSVDARADQLVRVTGDEAPVAMTVDYNTQFAVDMYRQLASENDKSLFVSPLSISNTLAMLVEGARGTTADELGKVLHLPEATRRTGDDAQLIPWETAKIYAGITRLNDILARNTDDKMTRQQAKVDELNAQLEAIRSEARAFSETPSHENAVLIEDIKKRRLEVTELRKKRKQQTKGTPEYQDLTNQINTTTDARRGKDKILRERRETFVAPLRSKEARLAKEYNAALKLLGGYQLKVANALWAEQSLPINQDYVDTVNSAFQTGGLRLANFRTGNERGRINNWIAANTNQKIQDFIQPGDLSANTRLILANAIYFQGDWEFPFKARRTKLSPFTKADGTQVKTPIMRETYFKHGQYGAIDGDGTVFVAPRMYDEDNPPKLYPDEKGFQLLSLPYRGDEVSMVWLAPMSHDGLANIESQMSGEKLTAWLGALKDRVVHVRVPKFRMEETYKLEETLKRLGLATLFSDSGIGSGGANLTGIVDGRNDEELFVAHVIHKTFVEVNEQGTEAAAATLAIGEPKDEESNSKMVPFTPKFTADRPFLFLIRHNQTGAVLFMGRMMNPETYAVID